MAITISAQQVLQIAIIPVLQQLFLTIIICLTNNDIFGHYEIAKLFITGSFLQLNEYNDIYHYIVVTETRKICRQLIRENTYKTGLDICISTSTAKLNLPPVKKGFCYDNFMRGELRIVSSSTYFAYLSECRIKDMPYWYYGEIDSPVKCGFSSSIMLRGEEIHNKRIQVKPACAIFHDKLSRILGNVLSA